MTTKKWGGYMDELEVEMWDEINQIWVKIPQEPEDQPDETYDGYKKGSMLNIVV